jgi:hypothetical protein
MGSGRQLSQGFEEDGCYRASVAMPVAAASSLITTEFAYSQKHADKRRARPHD